MSASSTSTNSKKSKSSSEIAAAATERITRATVDKISIKNAETKLAEEYGNNAFSKKEFRKSFKCRIQRLIKNRYPGDLYRELVSNANSLDPNLDVEFEEQLEFELIGIDASLANAIRRILLNEVPTMAIETVFVTDNTAAVQEEVLAHRLGLLPLLVDPDLFDNFQPKFEENPKTTHDTVPELDVQCQTTHLVFTLDKVNNGRDPLSVYSDDLVWKPFGNQIERGITVKQIPRILLTRLAANESVSLVCHAVKGIGATHAKWSPVATAFYRSKPSIRFKKVPTDQDAEKLVKVCPMNVFDIEDGHAIVARELSCTMCRECVRHDDLAPFVDLGREKQHFLFSIESTGAITPTNLFVKAVDALIAKCDLALESLQTLEEAQLK